MVKLLPSLSLIHLIFTVMGEIPPHRITETAPTTQSFFTGPLPTVQGQCSFGTDSSNAPFTNIFAAPDQLYVDFTNSANCNGLIARWEVCFTASSQPSSTNTIDFVILRYDERRRGYSIIQVYSLRISSVLMLLPSGLNCDYIEAEDSVFMEEGDLLGFVCSSAIRVALSELPEGVNSTLKVYNFAPANRQRSVERDSPLMGVRSVQQDDFETSQRALTPLIRIILSKNRKNA